MRMDNAKRVRLTMESLTLIRSGTGYWLFGLGRNLGGVRFLSSVAYSRVDVQDFGAVEEPVDHGVNHGGVAQSRAPFFDVEVRGHDQADPVLACVDQSPGAGSGIRAWCG